MIKSLYFITGNTHKFAEAKLILPNIEQLDTDLVEIQEMDVEKVLAAKMEEALNIKPEGGFFLEDMEFTLMD